MTRRSILEYAEAVRGRYLGSSKKIKMKILDEFVAGWNENKPGFLEGDLVAHCSDSSEGFYLTTLSTVDVATGWCEPVAVWGKGQDRVGGAVYDVRRRLPMPLLGLDSDNGSEFINQSLYDYCWRNSITFTRSRSYKKNDSCLVEQKNWAVVRRVIGYDRFRSKKRLRLWMTSTPCYVYTSISTSRC